MIPSCSVLLCKKNKNHDVITSSEWYQEYSRFVQLKGLGERSIKTYLGWIKRLAAHYPDEDISTLKSGPVLDFLLHLQSELELKGSTVNQALCALAATTYLATLGPHGLGDVAAAGAAAARQLEAALAEIGIARLHSAAYLNEFVVRVPDAATVHARLLERDLLAGLRLAPWYPADPELADALLLCTTELTTAEDIARLVAGFREVAA